MVDIRCIPGSSHPSNCGQGNEQEAGSCSRVARSHQMNTRGTTTAVVATAVAMHQQHSAGMTVVTPPAVGPEGTLEVVHVLLRNPPGQNASPSVAE
jgi:hypothetical protein